MGFPFGGNSTRHINMSMLNFDIRPNIIIGLGMYWAWVWTVFWSSLFYSAMPTMTIINLSGVMLLEPLWSISLFSNALTYIALFFLSRRWSPLGSHTSLMLWAAALACIGTFMIMQPALFFPDTVVPYEYIAGSLLTGVGSAIGLSLWAELLTISGSRQTLVYFVASTVFSALVYIVIILINPTLARILVAAMPLVQMWLMSRQRGTVVQAHRATLRRKHKAADKPLPHPIENDSANDDEDSEDTTLRIPSAPPFSVRSALTGLAGISLFFGISYGMMKGLFVTSTNSLIAARDLTNILALILSSIAIFITTSTFRMDFSHLTYQIALPLMAAGFLFFPLSSPYNIIGFGLHQFGYQYFYSVIWALWAVMAQRTDNPVAQYSCISIAAVQAGQLIGSVIGALLINFATTQYLLAMVSAFIVFVILLIALFMFGSPSTKSGWRVLKPFEQEQSTPKFRLACKKLADMRGLSRRETEVFELLAHGRNRSYISQQLCISDSTAKTHIKNIYRKFGVHSQQALLDMIELDAKSE